MVRVSLKKESDYLQFTPYRPIGAPKLRPQKERDQIAFGARVRTPIRLAPKTPYTRRQPSRILYVVLALVVILFGLLWRFHFLNVPSLLRLHNP